MVDIGQLVLAAALPVVEVVLICSAGAFARWKVSDERCMQLCPLVHGPLPLHPLQDVDALPRRQPTKRANADFVASFKALVPVLKVT